MPPHSHQNHIVMINKFYPPHVGGIERHLLDLSETLAAHGWKITVLVCNDARFETCEDIRRVHIIRVPQWGKFVSQPLTTHYFRRLRTLTPDLFHVHVPFPLGWIAAMKVQETVPIVCTWHSEIVRQEWLMRLLAPLEQRFLHRCKRIITTSEPLLITSKALQPHRDRCRVIPLSIPRPIEYESLSKKLVEQCKKKYPGRRVLFVGRLVEYKGLPYLLDAMESIPATLMIAGDGPARHFIEEYIRRLSYRDRIHLLGHVTEQEKQALYRAADVLVLPSISRNEAFGMVILEAQWQGCPVISTDLPTGVSWINQHGESGLVVPFADSAALAQAIRLLLTDESLRVRLSAGARRRVENHFSFETMVESIEQIYRELLASLSNPTVS